MLLGHLMKISWNVDRIYIFCALQYKYEELLNYTCLDIPESDVESIDVLLKKIIVALVAGLTFLRFTGLDNSPHQKSFRNRNSL